MRTQENKCLHIKYTIPKYFYKTKKFKFLRIALIKVVLQETLNQVLNLQAVGSTPVFTSAS